MNVVEFHPLAIREVQTAQDWFAARDPLVAAEFQSAAASAVERMRQQPEAQAIEFQHFRWVRFRRFPYRLVFEVLPAGVIFVLAFPHERRRPRYWRQQT